MLKYVSIKTKYYVCLYVSNRNYNDRCVYNVYFPLLPGQI